MYVVTVKLIVNYIEQNEKQSLNTPCYRTNWAGLEFGMGVWSMIDKGVMLESLKHGIGDAK